MPPYIDVALKSRQSLFEKDFLQDYVNDFSNRLYAILKKHAAFSYK